jgi:hypothetical protein
MGRKYQVWHIFSDPEGFPIVSQYKVLTEQGAFTLTRGYHAQGATLDWMLVGPPGLDVQQVFNTKTAALAHLDQLLPD